MFTNIAIGTGALSPTDVTKNLVAYLPGGLTSPTGFQSIVLTQALPSLGASTLITAVFVNVGATITEAALQAGGNTDGLSSLLATQSFTALPLGVTDNLTIAWTVVIAGS